jgi:peptide-methionine (S)-S-oxide reductase
MQQIILGGGCFWCVEAVFQLFDGVEDLMPGYAGGSTPNPSYREVCSGSTGHAEVVQVTFDSEKLSLENVLTLFFHAHDPTTLNRQGNDVGTQYRSAIYYQNEEQKTVIDKVIDQVEENEVWDRPIVTEVAPLDTFYPAEDYHKNYYKEHPAQPYCNAIIGPKVQKMKNKFSHLLNAES